MRIILPHLPTNQSLKPLCFKLLCVVSSWIMLSACGNIGNKKFYDGSGGIQGVTLQPNGTVASFTSVQVINFPNLKTESDKDGRFVLNKIPAGRREILMHNKKGLGIRMSVWIVNNRLTLLSNSQSTLLPTATVTGRVTAAPRLNYKGIRVSVAGFELSTYTHSNSGDFVLPQLPAGCHTIFFETPLFKRAQKENVCVVPSDKHQLKHSIQLDPLSSCQSSSTCGPGNICEASFCVPEGHGYAKQLTPKIEFKKLKLREESILSFDAVKNIGKGPLVLEKVAIEGNNEHFVLLEKELPKLPHTLGVGETLKVSVKFLTTSYQKKYMASLKIATNAPETPTVSTQLSGSVETKEIDCLAFENTKFNLGDQLSRNLTISTKVYNQCGEPIAISPSNVTKPPTSRETCGATVWGKFSMPTCVYTASNVAIVVPPGETRLLQWKLKPQGFGHLKGELKLLYSEPKRKEVQRSLSIQAYIKVPGLTIAPRVLEFGAMAPGSKRTLWLSLQFERATTINTLKTHLADKTSHPFKVLSTRYARTPQHPKTFYLPIQFAVPSSSSPVQTKLLLSNHPVLKGLPYHVPLQGSAATPRTPILPTTHFLSATESCASPTQSIYLTNPSTQSVVIESIQLLTVPSNSYEMTKVQLPLTLPPQTRLSIATLRWKAPTKQGVRALAQLQVRTRFENETPQILVSSLQSKKGFRHYDTFVQPKSSNLNVLLFVDQKTEDLSNLTLHLKALLRKLQSLHTEQKVKFSIHIMHETLVSPPITASSSNAETELIRALQARTVNPNHQGLETMKRTRELLRLPNSSSNTVLLFLSQSEDLSPYEVSAYIPDSHLFTIFSAAPSKNCKTYQSSYRYPTAARQSSGLHMDLCQAQSIHWKTWFAQIQNTLFGQRKRFPLQHKPASETIRVQVVQHGVSRDLSIDQPNREWRYEPLTNQIVLIDYNLPQNSQLNISYYTSCK